MTALFKQGQWVERKLAMSMCRKGSVLAWRLPKKFWSTFHAPPPLQEDSKAETVNRVFGVEPPLWYKMMMGASWIWADMSAFNIVPSLWKKWDCETCEESASDPRMFLLSELTLHLQRILITWKGCTQYKYQCNPRYTFTRWPWSIERARSWYVVILSTDPVIHAHQQQSSTC